MQTEYADTYPDLYQRHWWWRAREHFLLRRIGALLDGRTDARILDVGCGAGLFFDALSRYGHVEGIESDAASVARSGRWRDRIHRRELDESFTPSAPFDLVLALDVIEHVPEPVRLLANARRLLERNGHIVVTVPAFEVLWTAHDDLNHHLRRYSSALLDDTIAQAGLALIESRYLFPSLFVPKLLVRATEMFTERRGGLPRIPHPGLNAALALWFRAENAVTGWVPFGTSLLGVAAKERRD